MHLPDFIASQYRLYPLSEPQDIYKALFQACLGPEHALIDPALAMARLAEEASRLRAEQGKLVEQLSPEFCRVHLRVALAYGISMDEVFRAFVLSAEVRQNRDALLLYLAQWPAIATNGAEVSTFVAGVIAQGYPSMHHSQVFRAQYRPAYRVLHVKYVPTEWAGL